MAVTPAGQWIGQRDAPEYVGTARNLIAGNGFTFPFGEPGGPLDLTTKSSPLSFFPPGYPLLLALAGLVGLDPLDFSRYVPAVILASLTAGVLWIGSRLKTPTWTRWMVFAAVGASALVYGLSPSSELPYVAVLALTFWQLHRYSENPRFSILVHAGLSG